MKHFTLVPTHSGFFRPFTIPVGVLFLLASGLPAHANQVEDVKLEETSLRPVVEVYSSDGERWDKFVQGKSAPFRVKAYSECKYPLHGDNEDKLTKAYEGKLSLGGFSLSNVDPSGKSWRFWLWATINGQATYVGGGKTDPVEVCNAELDKRLATQGGVSKYEILAKGFDLVYPAAYRASFTLTCNPTGLGFIDYRTVTADISARIKCLASPKAAAKIPKPKPKPKKVDLALPIKGVKLKLDPDYHQGQCPVSIRLDATVDLNYPAEVKYQYIGDKGFKTPVFTLPKKAKGGAWNLKPWKRSIERPSRQGMLSAGPGKKPYFHAGWMKVKILSPVPMTSAPAKFKVRCIDAKVPGPGKLAPPVPGPKPKKPVFGSGAPREPGQPRTVPRPVLQPPAAAGSRPAIRVAPVKPDDKAD